MENISTSFLPASDAVGKINCSYLSHFHSQRAHHIRVMLVALALPPTDPVGLPVLHPGCAAPRTSRPRSPTNSWPCRFLGSYQVAASNFLIVSGGVF